MSSIPTPADSPRRMNAALAASIIGSTLTGFAAFMLGLLAFVRGSPVGAGALLGAAALAFGLLANAMLRR